MRVTILNVSLRDARQNSCNFQTLALADFFSTFPSTCRARYRVWLSPSSVRYVLCATLKSSNLLRDETHELRMKFVPRFRKIEVEGDAINRADLHALGCIKMSHAFGAFVRVNFVNLDALKNGVVRALRLANVTIDALVRNFKRQLNATFRLCRATPWRLADAQNH